MGTRARLAALVVAAALFAGCAAETEPATDVTTTSARLHSRVHCDAGDAGHYRYAYRPVGTAAWQGTPWVSFNMAAGANDACPQRIPESGEMDIPEDVTGLEVGTEYEYRWEWRRTDGTVVAADATGRPGTDYDRFTTTWPTVTASPAASFRNSIGVATHPTFFDTVHAREDAIAQKIADAGIRHVRNSMAYSNDAAWNQTVWANMATWGAHGIVSSWMVDRCEVNRPGNTHTSIREYLDKIAQLDSNLSSAIEGTNEVDHFCTGGFPAAERDWIQRLYQEVRAHPDPLIRSLPVLGPSFAHGGAAQLGDMSPWVDFGNTHPYAACGSPTPTHVQQNGIDAYQPVAPGKPVIVTEVGFHTAVNAAVGDGQPPCDERTAGVYTLRTVLEHFKLGIARSYLYEAVDLWPNPARNQPESNFGLLRNDLTPKPAYTAVKNLLTTVGAEAPPAVLRPLGMVVEQQPADLRTLVLARGDGTYVVALWRHASVWNRDQRVPLTVASSPVRLLLDAEAVTAVRPMDSPAEAPVALDHRRVTVGVAGDPVLLHVTPR